MADDTSIQAAEGSGGEFEREPVPKRALLGFKSFIGMYAGEHCAGTELMIGPLFIAAGVSAKDLIVGLLLLTAACAAETTPQDLRQVERADSPNDALA